MEGLWNLSAWDSEADYLLLDDVSFKHIGGSRKGIWGAQKEIVLDGKYMRRKSYKWGKPLIFLCNEDNFYRTLKNDRGLSYLTDHEMDWYDANSVVVEITRRMYLTEEDEL